MSKTAKILNAIADNLEQNVSDENFNINEWLCGTMGCAIGHSINLPEVKKTKLRLVTSFFGRLNPTLKIDPHCALYSYEAISTAFGITEKIAEYLFCPDEYEDNVPKAKVISRIREYAQKFPSLR